jgi:hypothetical protein
MENLCQVQTWKWVNVFAIDKSNAKALLFEADEKMMVLIQALLLWVSQGHV